MTAHKLLRPVLLIAGLLIFPAIAANTVNTVMPVSETDFDPCSNEDVNLVGNVHLVANMTFNDNTAHIIGEANEHLEGTGASSGASYLANATAHVEFNLDIDPASETGSVTLALSTAQLIGQGNVPNANVQLHIHFTVNANGTVTAFIDSVRLTCN